MSRHRTPTTLIEVPPPLTNRSFSRSYSRTSSIGRASNQSGIDSLGTPSVPTPPANASSSTSASSPRRRSIAPRKNLTDGIERTKKSWVYEPPKSHFNTTYKDVYGPQRQHHFTHTDSAKSKIYTYKPTSKKETALETAAKEPIKAIVGRTRPAGFYYNKFEEDQDLRMQEELYEADEFFHQAAKKEGFSKTNTPLNIAMQREATARELQVKNFLELNRKLHLDMNYYGPNYANKQDQSIIDDLVKSKNFEGRMNALRSKRRHVTLNSSREVQNCISPRDLATGNLAGYGGEGKPDCWPEKHRAERHRYLMENSRKRAHEKANHMVRNPITGFMNVLVRNNMKPTEMWKGSH